MISYTNVNNQNDLYKQHSATAATNDSKRNRKTKQLRTLKQQNSLLNGIWLWDALQTTNNNSECTFSYCAFDVFIRRMMLLCSPAQQQQQQWYRIQIQNSVAVVVSMNVLTSSYYLSLSLSQAQWRTGSKDVRSGWFLHWKLVLFILVPLNHFTPTVRFFEHCSIMRYATIHNAKNAKTEKKGKNHCDRTTLPPVRHCTPLTHFHLLSSSSIRLKANGSCLESHFVHIYGVECCASDVIWYVGAINLNNPTHHPQYIHFLF